MLGKKVPMSAQRELVRLKTLDQVWRHLDNKYGNKITMCNQRVAELNAFRISAQARTEAAKMMELHEIWRDVYCDLEYVGCEADLNPNSVVQVFVSKFPTKLKDYWIDFFEKPENAAVPTGKLLNDFMIWTGSELWLWRSGKVEASLVLKTDLGKERQGLVSGAVELTTGSRVDVRILGKGQMLLPGVVMDPEQGVVIAQFATCCTSVPGERAGLCLS